MATWKKIVFWREDKKIFMVEEQVMIQSQTIKNRIENGCFNDKIPVLSSDSTTLSKVIDYCTMHTHNKDVGDDKLKDWDVNFANVDKPQDWDAFFNLVIVSNCNNNFLLSY